MNPLVRSGATRYSAILWDNDGVLVDTERLYFKATQEVFAEAGVDLSVEHYAEYFLYRSGGTTKFATAHGLNESHIASMQDARNDRYRHLLQHEAITISGVRETLAALRPHFVMGIVTSSRRHNFETMHRRTGLLEFFDFVLTREDYAQGKPAADPYLAGIVRSGQSPDRCLAIEDAPRGVAAARAAALDCWVIRSALTLQAMFPDAARVIDSVTDVPRLLLPARASP